MCGLPAAGRTGARGGCDVRGRRHGRAPVVARPARRIGPRRQRRDPAADHRAGVPWRRVRAAGAAGAPRRHAAAAGDVATVVDGFAETDQFGRFDGEPTMLVSIFRTGEQSDMEIARPVDDLHGRRPGHPARGEQPDGLDRIRLRDCSDARVFGVDVHREPVLVGADLRPERHILPSCTRQECRNDTAS